ncbi:hypothetical protein Tco_1522863 [Tanacetum coccineum]
MSIINHIPLCKYLSCRIGKWSRGNRLFNDRQFLFNSQYHLSKFFNQLQYTPKLPLDEEESSFDEILDDLFRIGAENIRNMEHEVPNRYDDINGYEDCDHENGKLLDLPTFFANEIASDSEQVEENTDIVE